MFVCWQVIFFSLGFGLIYNQHKVGGWLDAIQGVDASC